MARPYFEGGENAEPAYAAPSMYSQERNSTIKIALNILEKELDSLYNNIQDLTEILSPIRNLSESTDVEGCADQTFPVNSDLAGKLRNFTERLEGYNSDLLRLQRTVDL